MKKLISLVCVLALVIGVAAVSAVGTNAAEAAKTAVDVVKGDEITYTLTLGGVAEPIIGCDFSVYYDADIFEKVEIADFEGKTSQREWTPTINPNLDGQIRGNWSILSGVDFSETRSFLTVKFKAIADGTGHISYFIRYMYDNNIFNSDDKPQITEYKFTCDVLKNGEPVLEDAQPELNVEENQNTGLFVNSITGDSADADPDIPGTVVKKTAQNVNNAGSNSNNAANNSGDNNNAANGGAAADNGGNASGGGAVGSVSGGNASGSGANGDANATAAPPATTAEGYYITATDADGNVLATSDEAPATATTGNNNKEGSPVLWIIIVLVVIAGGGAAAFFYMKKKSAADPSATDTSASEPAAEAAQDTAPAEDDNASAPDNK